MSLLQSYGLLENMTKIEPYKASYDDLASFHSKEYLDFCDEISNTADQEKYTSSLEEKLKSHSSSIENEYGVEFDCPIVPNISKLIAWVAGGSLCKLKFYLMIHIRIFKFSNDRFKTIFCIFTFFICKFTAAAKWLTAGNGTKAINWGGGWHHAQRDKVIMK